MRVCEVISLTQSLRIICAEGTYTHSMMLKSRHALIFATLAIAGCDWVDSAGNSSSSSAPPPTTDVFLDDTPIGRAIVVDEDSPTRITATRDSVAGDSQTFTWSESPVEEGALSICSLVDGFDSALAADSFAEACTTETDCSLAFEQIDAGTDEVAEFLMRVPRLKASVGVRHTLSVTDQNGDSSTTDYEFCLLAINDPPNAVDDPFVVLEGGTLEVGVDDINLLSNDSDDVDVSNQPLRVATTPVRPPEFAESFELRADGGFTYVSADTGARGDLVDSFVYEISDGGLVPSMATARIRIVVRNLAPTQIEAIPALTASVGQFFVLDLGVYFSDPEGSILGFTIREGDLPESDSLELTQAGVLSGTPLPADVGEYEVRISASDGTSAAEASLLLTIIDETPVIDSSGEPRYIDETVFDQVISIGQRISPVAPQFEDPDGDVLVYRSAGTTFARGLTLDLRTGVLSGRPLSRGLTRGMRIRATDPDGNTAISDRFVINVR